MSAGGLFNIKLSHMDYPLDNSGATLIHDIVFRLFA